jgi:serine protease Do
LATIIHRKSPLVLLVVLILILSAGASFAAKEVDSTRLAVETAVNAVKPALVKISVVAVDYDQGREVKQEAVGSGVIISKDGHVVTNHHVAGDSKLITCTLADKSEIEADLVGTDAMSDIAVLKLRPAKNQVFPVARFGDSSKLRVGDRVFAMGSPLAFSQSVTMGVVSNTELVIPTQFSWFELTLDGEDVGSLVRWIAHDAAIYPGNSGGPLVNSDGEIIGINEIDIGLSGAIPGNLAKEVADQIIKSGKVKRCWLGITTQPLLKSFDRKTGVLIGGTVEGSPAEKAGFLSGDILIKCAGKPCTVRFQEEVPIFNHFLMSLPAGKEVEAVVVRDGKEVTLKVTPIDREDAIAKPGEFRDWGICASNITFLESKSMKRPGKDGVLVTSVGPGGPAGNAKPAIAEGDIIVRVAEKPVKRLDDLRTVTQEVMAGKTDPVPTVVAFERGLNQYLTVVKIGRQDPKDPGLEVRKAWLPAAVQVLTRDIAEALGMKGQTGVRVTQVYPNTTAEKAGLKVGDIIITLDGMPINASQPEDVEVLPAMVRQYKIGTIAELGIVRDGQKSAISVELVTSPKLVREMKKYRDDVFEFTARDISFFDRVSNQWSQEQAGVLVDSVSEGGWASLGGLGPGDLIVGVDGKNVTDVASFEETMKKMEASRPKTTIFRLKSGVSDAYVELEPTWPAD